MCASHNVPTKIGKRAHTHIRTHRDTHVPAVGEILIKCVIQPSQLLFMKAWLSPESQSDVLVGLVRLVVMDTSDTCMSSDEFPK